MSENVELQAWRQCEGGRANLAGQPECECPHLQGPEPSSSSVQLGCPQMDLETCTRPHAGNEQANARAIKTYRHAAIPCIDHRTRAGNEQSARKCCNRFQDISPSRIRTTHTLVTASHRKRVAIALEAREASLGRRGRKIDTLGGRSQKRQQTNYNKEHFSCGI